jgi:hypothetical protein
MPAQWRDIRDQHRASGFVDGKQWRVSIPEKPGDFKANTRKRSSYLNLPLGLDGVVPAGKSSCDLHGKRKHKGSG